MLENLPSILNGYIEPLPPNRLAPAPAQIIEKFAKLYGDDYVNSLILSQEDAENVLKEIGIERGTSFYNFYLHSFELPKFFRTEDLFGLAEIYEEFKKPFRPELPKGFLQISSIEGEYSLYYEIKTDQVYGVGWAETKEFLLGEITPKFFSFHEFLIWYFSDAKE